MRTPWISVGLFAVAALLGAVGQWLYQAGAVAAGRAVQRGVSGAVAYLSNPRLWAGVVCYVAVMVLFVAAFRIGGRLTVLYPVYASTFIWAALLAWWTQGQPIRPVHVAGMATLILGMYLMGKS